MILYIDNIIIIATTNERKKIEKIDDNNYFNNLIDNFVPKSFKLSWKLYNMDGHIHSEPSEFNANLIEIEK